MMVSLRSLGMSETETIFQTKKDINKITVGQLYALLYNQKGATIVTFLSDTIPRMNQKSKQLGIRNPHYGNLRCLTVVNGMINFSYSKAVRGRLIKEGKDPKTFQLGQSWHENVLKNGKITPIYVHKKNKNMWYMGVMILRELRKRYVTYDGEDISIEDISPFLQSGGNYLSQGLQKPVIFKTYALNSIKEIVVNKNKYLVK